MDISLAQTLLTASVTGAGLVFAFSSVIQPMLSVIKAKRDKDYLESLRRARDTIQKYLAETNKEDKITDEDLSNLTDAIEEIEEKRKMPNWLFLLPTLVFILYILSALFALFFLINFYVQICGEWLPYSFGSATVLFGILGINTLKSFKETYT